MPTSTRAGRPYDALRKMFATFGIDAAARDGLPTPGRSEKAGGGPGKDRAPALTTANGRPIRP